MKQFKETKQIRLSEILVTVLTVILGIIMIMILIKVQLDLLTNYNI